MTARAATIRSTMIDEEATPAEVFPIAYSTAYLALAALITIRENEDQVFDLSTAEYAASVLELIKHQPDTVTSLPPQELEETGPLLLDNASTWLP